MSKNKQRNENLKTRVDFPTTDEIVDLFKEVDPTEIFATRVEFSEIVEEEVEEVEEVVPENSGPAAPLMEKQDEPATTRYGNCPNCGHQTTIEVGLTTRCINCSQVVILK